MCGSIYIRCCVYLFFGEEPDIIYHRVVDVLGCLGARRGYISDEELISVRLVLYDLCSPSLHHLDEVSVLKMPVCVP